MIIPRNNTTVSEHHHHDSMRQVSTHSFADEGLISWPRKTQSEFKPICLTPKRDKHLSWLPLGDNVRGRIMDCREGPGRGLLPSECSIWPMSGYCVYHRDHSSRFLCLKRAVKSRTEEHGSFLGQEPAWNPKSHFTEQSVSWEMNVAELTGCVPSC